MIFLKIKLPAFINECSSNFIVVMANLNLFDNNKILEEYQFLNDDLKNNSTVSLISQKKQENLTKYLNHKELIKIIRNIN